MLLKTGHETLETTWQKRLHQLQVYWKMTLLKEVEDNIFAPGLYSLTINSLYTD